MAHPLHVAFLWHMHQPYYRDASTGDFALPWTRLHATKDYLHMAEVLADFPSVHATFNFVPSLVEQLEDYAAGYATDRALRVSLKEQLSSDDKEYLLSFFFNINWDHLLNRYPPYRELLRQRQEAHGDWRRFPDQYWLDLIVWFNLAWFDPGYILRDPELKALADKGADFTRADIHLVAHKSRGATGASLAAYRRLAARGQIEICTSPYYHPILPLLADNASAWEATPGLPLPQPPFAYPEDALEQVRRGLLAHRQVFGRPAGGVWPPEGALSQAVVDLLARHTSVRWVASDEALLARSLGVGIERDGSGEVTNPAVLYQPYGLGGAPRPAGVPPLAIVFRDRLLADRIGFVYQHIDSRTAAEDMVQRLRHIAGRLGASDQPHLVSIILDGENCWESYENNGDDFLRHLYGLLAKSADVKTVTLSEHLSQYPPGPVIERLRAGSWIGGDMLTWIGEPAQNLAWEYLARTRERLASHAANDHSTSLDVIGQAWQHLYTAEGSDWMWWYSSRNTPDSNTFDSLFRGHLAEVYRNLGLPAPDWIGQPITVQRRERRGKAPAAYVSPVLSANELPSQGWAQAGQLEPDQSAATMQRGAGLLRRLYFGFDADNLYLRIELSVLEIAVAVAVYFSTPRGRANLSAPLLPRAAQSVGGARWSHELRLDMRSRQAHLLRADGHEGWKPGAPMQAAFGDSVVEARIGLDALQARAGDMLGIVVALARDGVVEERHPMNGELNFRLIRPGNGHE